MQQAAASRIPAPNGTTFWRKVIGWYRMALERRRQRRALADLDDHLLKDIGLSREEARRESTKSLWL